MNFKIILLSACLFYGTNTFAEIIFDNGGVVQTNPTFNDVYPGRAIFDDFVLSDTTTITGLEYSIFTTNADKYVQTYISIWDDVGVFASVVIPEFSVTGNLTANGLTTPDTNLENGFDVNISGLSIELVPGTYFLGISTEVVDEPGSQASIGSGDGSAETIGAGMYQSNGTDAITVDQRIGDHMSFLLFSAPVYSCVGGKFSPPFDLPLALKKQTKRAISVKMALEDGNGIPIIDSDLSAPPVVNVVFDFNPGDGTENDSSLVPTGLSDDGNAFRFDMETGQWVINLATKQYTSSGTYTVTADEGDDSYTIDSSCTGTFVRLE